MWPRSSKNSTQRWVPWASRTKFLLSMIAAPTSSAARGQNIADTSSYVKVIRHSKNCGQSAAVATGFANANGEFIITLDSDLQNDPADLPKLIEALTPDLAAVCGRRANRQDNFIRKASSRIGNGVRNWLTGDQVADTGCALRVIRKSALYEIPVFNGLHRFLPTLLRIKGHQVIEIPVSHRPRVAGVSKYGVANRAWRGLVDCIAIRWFKKRAFPANRLK